MSTEFVNNDKFWISSLYKNRNWSNQGVSFSFRTFLNLNSVKNLLRTSLITCFQQVLLKQSFSLVLHQLFLMFLLVLQIELTYLCWNWKITQCHVKHLAKIISIMRVSCFVKTHSLLTRFFQMLPYFSFTYKLKRFLCQTQICIFFTLYFSCKNTT